MHKKEKQLGMNPSTASHRLIKDLLFRFVIASGHKCFRCGGELTRQTFSVEHKVAWLDSEDPVKTFFDVDNIAYSHNTCNGGAKRKPTLPPIKHGTFNGYNDRRCRCEQCKSAAAARQRQTRATGRTAADRAQSFSTGVYPPPDTRLKG